MGILYHIWLHPFFFSLQLFSQFMSARAGYGYSLFSFNKDVKASFACFVHFVLALTLFLAEFTAG